MQIPLIVLSAMIVMMVCERCRPAVRLPRVRGWWPRALGASVVQAAIVVFVAPLWEPLIQAHPLLNLQRLSPWAGALVGYLAITFVYYFWHRARHRVPWLWRTFHQLHHSPARIEVVASFYKHPAEILVNGVLSSAVLYGLCGLGVEAAASATLLTGLAELVYHWNVRTPRWLGYFFQRPEMHRLHHAQGVHHYNYSDLPLWDLLFGTFRNPEVQDAPTGFGGEREQELVAMLLAKDVRAGERRPEAETPAMSGPADRRSMSSQSRWALFILALGSMQMVGDVLGISALVGLGAASHASPAPKVFTVVGDAEPFSATFELELEEASGAIRRVPLDRAHYRRLRGPYNRRNVIGAVVAGGPHLHGSPHLGPMMEATVRDALCGESAIARELEAKEQAPVVRATIMQTSRDGRVTRWSVAC